MSPREISSDPLYQFPQLSVTNAPRASGDRCAISVFSGSSRKPVDDVAGHSAFLRSNAIETGAAREPLVSGIPLALTLRRGLSSVNDAVRNDVAADKSWVAMSRENIVVMLTRSGGRPLELATSRLARLAADLARLVILVDDGNFCAHLMEGKVKLISVPLLRAELRLLAPRYSAMNDGTFGFNISLQRTLCALMTASGMRVLMLDDDIVIDRPALLEMFRACEYRTAVGVNIIGQELAG